MRVERTAVQSLFRRAIGECGVTECAARLTVVSDIVIRPAERHDVPALATLRWQFKIEDADGDMGSENEVEFTARCEGWLETRIPTGSWRVWLAEVAGRPCGHVFLGLVDKVPGPFSGAEVLGYVTNFYVTPEQRNRGLGTALLGAVNRYARAHALDTLIVWPSERSAPLYRRHGFGLPDELLENSVTPD